MGEEIDKNMFDLIDLLNQDLKDYKHDLQVLKDQRKSKKTFDKKQRQEKNRKASMKNNQRKNQFMMDENLKDSIDLFMQSN